MNKGTQSRSKPLWPRVRRLLGRVRRRLLRKPKLLVFPPLVFGVLLSILISGSFKLEVLIAAAILAGCSQIAVTVGEPPYSYGLPKMTDGPPAPSRIPPTVYARVTQVVVGLFVILQVFDIDGLFSLGLAGLAIAAWLVASETQVRRLWHLVRFARALRSYGATLAIGFAGRSGGPWQLRMWEPYLLQSGERLVTFNLHAKYIEMILEGANLTSPFIQMGANPKGELDGLLLKGIKVLFYVQNAQRNAMFMSHKEIVHVWLGHGDSDKPASSNPRHANYDHLVVCGQAGIDRYHHNEIQIPDEKFTIVGRPQASGIAPARGPIKDITEPAVLYAPTWHGLDNAVDFSSLSRSPEIIRALIDRGATVIFRPHPLSKRWKTPRDTIHEVWEILEADKAESGRPHVWGEQSEDTWNFVDCVNHSDALISDLSSVVSDFLQSEKPYAMVSMRAPADEFRKEFAIAQTSYVILSELQNLSSALDDLLDLDPLAEERAARRRYVLGDFTGEESADAFAAYVRDLSGN